MAQAQSEHVELLREVVRGLGIHTKVIVDQAVARKLVAIDSAITALTVDAKGVECWTISICFEYFIKVVQNLDFVGEWKNERRYFETILNISS